MRIEIRNLKLKLIEQELHSYWIHQIESTILQENSLLRKWESSPWPKEKGGYGEIK